MSDGSLIRRLARGLGRVLRLAGKLVLSVVWASYILVARSLLMTLGLGFVVYFFVQSSAAPQLAGTVLGGVMDGRVTMSAIYWGARPDQLVVLDARLADGRGDPMIYSPIVEADLDVGRTVRGMAARLLWGDDDVAITVRIERAVLRNPQVLVTIGEDGYIPFVEAWTPPNPSGDPSPDFLDIWIERAEIYGADGLVDTPEVQVAITDLDAVGEWGMQSDAFLLFGVSELHADRVDVSLEPANRPSASLERLEIPLTDVSAHGFRYEHDRLRIGGLTGVLEGDGGSVRGEGRMELHHDVPRWELELQALAPEGSRLLRDFSGGLLDGAFSAELRGKGDVAWASAQIGVRSPALTIAGAETLEGFSGQLVLDPVVTPDGTMTHLVRVHEAVGRVWGGRIRTGGATYGPTWATPVAGRHARTTRNALSGTFEVEGVNPYDALDGEAMSGLAAAQLPFLDGRLDGEAGLTVWSDDDGGGVVARVRTDGLRLRWGGDDRLPLDEDLTLAGEVTWVSEPPGALGLAPSSRVEFVDVSLDSGRDALRLSGAITLPSGGDEDDGPALDLVGNARVADLGGFLQPLGGDGVGGALLLSPLSVSGRWDDPRVQADLRVAGASLVGEDVGTVRGRLDLERGLLHARGVDVDAPWGRIGADGQIRLWSTRLTELHPRMPFVVTRAAIGGLDLAALAPTLGIAARVDLSTQGDVRGDARQPLDTLVGQAKLSADRIALGGERATRAEARLSATEAALLVDKAYVQLATGERLRGSLRLRKRDERLSANVQMRDMPMTAFQTFEREDLPLRGRVTANLTFEGSVERPQVIGTLETRAFGFGDIALGDASLTLTPGDAGEVLLSANRFFDGLELGERSWVQLDGFVPTRLHLEASARRADVFRIFPPLAFPDTTVTFGQDRAPGEASTALGVLDVRFTDPPKPNSRRGRRKAAEPPWRLTLTGDPGDLELERYEGDVRMRNTTRAAVALSPDGTDISPVTVAPVGGGPSLTACGDIGTDGDLDLRFVGGVDLDVVRLRDLFSVLEGQLVVGEAPPDLAAAFGEGGCHEGAGARLVRLVGPTDALVWEGRLDVEQLLAVPRSLPREFRVDDASLERAAAALGKDSGGARDARGAPQGDSGGQASEMARLRPGVTLRGGARRGEQLVVFEEEQARRLRGELDDASFSVHGEAGFLNWLPDRVDLRLEGTDVFYAAPGQFKMVFNPDVRLRVTDFQSDDARRLALSGAARVTEALYYESFDLLNRALDSAVGGGTDASFSEGLTDTLPWLADLQLDLDVDGTNCVVRSPFTLGKTDIDTRLDLRVAGTLGAPELFERISLVPGGTVRYQLFDSEFEIVQGTIDFNGDPGRAGLDITAQTEVTFYEATNPDGGVEQERTVTISLLITGQLPEPEVQLISDDRGFDQGDLQSLLLTGRPIRGGGRSGDNSLFSLDMSNLVEEVLRAPFIDDASVILTNTGGWGVGLRTVFGRTLSLRTRAVQETIETRVSAGFEFRISDAVSLEGRLVRVDSTTNPTQTYEARLKYRIPLD